MPSEPRPSRRKAGSQEPDELRHKARTSCSRRSVESTDSGGDVGGPAQFLQLVDPGCESSLSLLQKVSASLERLLDGGTEISSQNQVEQSESHAKTYEWVPVNASMLATSSGSLLQAASPFFGLRAPVISIEGYLQRIAHYTKCSPACFVTAIAYIDAMNQRNHCFVPCALSIHRLMLVGTLLSCKLLDDKRYSNAFWAKVSKEIE
jgi:hypothetical protein